MQINDLCDAAYRGNLVELQRLIDQNANVNAARQSDTYKRTALHASILSGNEQVVQFLLDRHANVQVVDTELETPLHVACRFGKSAMVRLLLQQSNVQVDATDHIGRTALHVATSYANTDSIGLLLQHDAVVNALDLESLTPLHLAAGLGLRSTAVLLIDNGADCSITSVCDSLTR
jgi:ankyrin repeat protein